MKPILGGGFLALNSPKGLTMGTKLKILSTLEW